MSVSLMQRVVFHQYIYYVLWHLLISNSEGGTHCVPVIVHGSVISCSCKMGCFFIYQNNGVCIVYIHGGGGVKTFSLQSLEWGTI